MALTADQIMALNLHDYHQMILPYLNGGNMWTKIWENADPTSSMSPQDITIPSIAGYKRFIIFFAQYINGDGAKMMAHSTFLKGYGTDLMWVLGGNNGVTVRRRDVSFTDDTTLHVGNCKAATGTTAQTNENNANIPIVLYAIG